MGASCQCDRNLQCTIEHVLFKYNFDTIDDTIRYFNQLKNDYKQSQHEYAIKDCEFVISLLDKIREHLP